MAKYTEIIIPLDAHLVKYLAGRFKNQTYHVKKKSELGRYIIGMLQERPSKPVKPRGGRKLKRYELRLQICTRYTENSNSGAYLSDEAMVEIKRKIDMLFREHLRGHVRQQYLNTGTEERYLLREFFTSFNILEEDFSEESMYRDYMRWKKKRKINTE